MNAETQRKPSSSGDPLAGGKLSTGAKLGYGVGDLSSGLMFQTINFYFLYFLTDVVRLLPQLAGLAVMLGKVYDGVTDPVMGYLSDRTRTRWGRRRPYLLLSAIPFGLAFFLVFLSPALTQTGKFWYALGMFVFLCTWYTVFTVPYAAMTADLTRDYDERTNLTSYRMLFSILGTLIAGAATMIIVGLKPTEKDGFAFMGLIFGAVIAVAAIVCFLGTKERAAAADDETTLPFFAGMRLALANRPFRMALVIYLLSQCAMAIVSALLIYYLKYAAGLGEQSSLVFGLLLVVAIASLPLWVKLSAKMGKARAFALGLGIQGTAMLLFALLPTGMPWAVYALVVVAGVGTATHFIFPWSMIPDVVEYDQLTTGQRRAGTFYGLWLLTQKVAAATGVMLSGALLGFFGYSAGAEQSARALLGLRLGIGPVPVLLLVAAALLLLRYPINRSAHEAVVRQIEAGRATPTTPTSTGHKAATGGGE